MYLYVFIYIAALRAAKKIMRYICMPAGSARETALARREYDTGAKNAPRECYRAPRAIPRKDVTARARENPSARSRGQPPAPTASRDCGRTGAQGRFWGVHFRWGWTRPFRGGTLSLGVDTAVSRGRDTLRPRRFGGGGRNTIVARTCILGTTCFTQEGYKVRASLTRLANRSSWVDDRADDSLRGPLCAGEAFLARCARGRPFGIISLPPLAH